MKLYDFVNFVGYNTYIVPYECASVGLVVIEVFTWLFKKGILLYDNEWQVMLPIPIGMAT